MMSESTWDQFQAVLRQIVELKKSGVTGAAIETLVEEAWDLWPQVPPPPAGRARVWPPELFVIARELGFDRSPMTTEEIEPLEKPVDLDELAKEIDQAITAAGGVGNVRVACSPERIVLSGIAADEEARDQALLVAAKLAPGIEIEDAIDVA